MRRKHKLDFWWLLFAALAGFLVLAFSVRSRAADILLMVGDQPGDIGYRDGDVINVYTRAMIDGAWDQIPKNEPKWVGNPRTSMPFSNTILSHFCVFNVADADADSNRDSWIARDLVGGVPARKREHWIFWWEHLTEQQRLDLMDRNTVADMRAITMATTDVLTKSTTPRVFNCGDSITLQSADPFATALPGFEVHTNVVNSRDSWQLAANVYAYMEDPDNNPGTPAPGTYDVVRWNCGMWDCQPHGTFNDITSSADFRSNFRQIVSEIRRHSPRARIIYSNSRDIDPNRLTLDPLPEFTDIDTYNAALAGYRTVVSEECPIANVVLDDKNAFYTSRTPAQEGLSPSHANTGVYWSWDGIHFDVNYQPFEGQLSAQAVQAAQ